MLFIFILILYSLFTIVRVVDLKYILVKVQSNERNMQACIIFFRLLCILLHKSTAVLNSIDTCCSNKQCFIHLLFRGQFLALLFVFLVFDTTSHYYKFLHNFQPHFSYSISFIILKHQRQFFNFSIVILNRCWRNNSVFL